MLIGMRRVRISGLRRRRDAPNGEEKAKASEAKEEAGEAMVVVPENGLIC